MEMNLTKSERTIAVIALVVIAVFIAMFIQVSRGTKAEPLFTSGSAIDYTMARPEQAYSEYTLEGRELDQSFEGLPQSQNPVQLDKRKKELIAKKAAETKKKEDVKKKQVTQARAQEAKVKEQIQNQKYAERSRDRSEVKSDSSPVTNVNREPYANGTVVAPAPATDNRTQQVKPKKTYVEWRTQLFASPTSETLALFIAAYRKNDVTVTEFQAMAQDLVDQSEVKHKAIGLMALRSAPSLASLSQLVHLQPAALGSYQSYVDQSILSYLQPQNIQYLNQALATKDKVLVAKSLNILSANLLKFSQGDLAGLVDPRNRREGEVVSFSMNSYRTLLPVLGQLGSSQDPEFSALAQQITALIQTSNNVAQN